ncbi:MAG: hypothetical protein V4679_14510 [Pseudomonadota bacterium]
MRRLPTLLLLALGACATGAHAIIRCEFNGKSVNPSNGAETAGLTGLLRCRDENTGQLQREQELKDGKYLGKERFFDRDGKLTRERSVNERGNSQGRVAEFWPNGQLKREELAENGSTVGAVRRFDANGRPERLSFHAAGQEQFAIEYNAAGQPTRLQCPRASVLPEDRKPCGFEGPADTLLYTGSGAKAGQVRYDQGRMLLSTEWTSDGLVAQQMLYEEGRRVHRSFFTEDGKSVLREERIFAPDGQRFLRDTRGPLHSLRRFGSTGQLIEQHGYADGREVLLERWYLNGSARERSTMTGTGETTRIQRELRDDEGRLTRRELLTEQQQRTGVQQQFHANGRVAQEDRYTAPDARGRTRLEARKQWDDSGKLVADDTILEDGSRQRKAGAIDS